MNAGRELDALVAEKVFGWTDVCAATRTLYGGTTWFVPHGRPDAAFMKYAEVPSYSTDIAAAWLVVEKLRPKFWTKLCAGMTLTESPLHECAMGLYATEDGPSHQLAYERDASAPLAICRAALAAAPT